MRSLVARPGLRLGGYEEASRPSSLMLARVSDSIPGSLRKGHQKRHGDGDAQAHTPIDTPLPVPEQIPHKDRRHDSQERQYERQTG